MTTKQKGIIAISITLAVLIIATIVLAAVTNGFQDWGKPEPNTGADTPAIVYDGDGNAMESGKVYPMSSRMVFTAPMSDAADTGVTLQATITPASAVDKAVDWTVSWVNPSSDFAKGKTVTNYVTVTPQATAR